MKKETVEKWMKRYLKLRTVISPLLYKYVYRVPLENLFWETVREYSLWEFSKAINAYDYKYDKGMGLLDASFLSSEPDYFFQELKDGRDCDDFARIWRLWCEHQGWRAWEYVMLNYHNPFSSAHVVCYAIEPEGASGSRKHWILDYAPEGPFDTQAEAFEFLKRKHGEDTLYVRYEHEAESV